MIKTEYVEMVARQNRAVSYIREYQARIKRQDRILTIITVGLCFVGLVIAIGVMWL